KFCLGSEPRTHAYVDPGSPELLGPLAVHDRFCRAAPLVLSWPRRPSTDRGRVSKIMSLLARLAPHLPYVRRYARALTGDQATGDNYVRVALEALAAGEAQLDANLTPRVALYRVFHAIWCSTGAQL